MLGIPYQWQNREIKKILYQPSDDYNNDQKCPKAIKFNKTEIVFNMKMHFTESQYISKFYTFNDVLATLGGLLSSITLLSSQLSVIYIVYFLLKVTVVIQNKIKKDYQERLV